MKRKYGVGLALAGLVGGTLVAANMAGAALTPAQLQEPIGFYRFCANAQLEIAKINEANLSAAGLSIGGEIYGDFDDFVLSKSGVDPNSGAILTTSYVDYLDTGLTQPAQFRCKMRTSASLTAGAWPAGSPNNTPGFERPPYYGFGSTAAGVSGGVGTCQDINQNTIDDVWGTLSPAQQAAAPFKPTNGTLVADPDIVTGDGPTWTQPIDPLVVTSGVLHAQGKALNVPIGAAGNARLEGAAYCTSVAPEYLQNVLLGTATP